MSSGLYQIRDKNLDCKNSKCRILGTGNLNFTD